MIGTLALVGGCAGLAALTGLMVRRRREPTDYERRAGIRTAWYNGAVFRAEVQGLPFRGSCVGDTSRPDAPSLQHVSLSVPVVLSPSAELYVGPDSFLMKPMGFLFTGWPRLDVDCGWLADRGVRGRPEAAAAEALRRVSLQPFDASLWRVEFFYVRGGKLEMRIRNEGSSSPERLRDLLSEAAGFAFKLMG